VGGVRERAFERAAERDERQTPDPLRCHSALRVAGDDPDGAPSPQGPVADAVRRTVEAMHVVLVPVGVVQVVTTTAHHQR
jgi:hypothetical protein